MDSCPRARPSEPPGSDGERRLQNQLGTSARAQRFYDEQMLDHLNPQMRDFVRRQKMMFIATSDVSGACDSSFRAGPPGFVEVLDEQTLAWPEFRGNGVMASLGNISENPHVGLLMVDFADTVGLHVNGRARVVDAVTMARVGLTRPANPAGRSVAVWVEVAVDEAYIHCSKHVPRLAELDTDGAVTLPRRKTADYFGAAAESARRDEAAS